MVSKTRKGILVGLARRKRLSEAVLLSTMMSRNGGHVDFSRRMRSFLVTRRQFPGQNMYGKLEVCSRLGGGSDALHAIASRFHVMFYIVLFVVVGSVEHLYTTCICCYCTVHARAKREANSASVVKQLLCHDLQFFLQCDRRYSPEKCVLPRIPLHCRVAACSSGGGVYIWHIYRTYWKRRGILYECEVR